MEKQEEKSSLAKRLDEFIKLISKIPGDSSLSKRAVIDLLRAIRDNKNTIFVEEIE